MWLDFARDYGMVVFGLLIAFEATAVSSKYIFILGMFVYGAIAGRAGEGHKE